MASARPLARLTAIIGAGALAASLAACGTSSSDPSTTASTSSGPIKVGQTIGITGPAGAYGKAKNDGQKAWLQYVNDNGGVNGRPIELTTLDDGLDVATAVSNARTLVSQDMVAILNGNGGGSVDALVPVLEQAKVPFLFPAKSSTGWIDTPSPYAFGIIPTWRDQASAIITEAFKRTGPGSVYLVATPSVDLDPVVAVAKAATESGGGKWLGNNAVPFGTSNVTPFALQAAADRPDYILFQSAPAETTKIVASLTESGSLPAKGILALSSLPGATFLQATTAKAQDLVLSISAVAPPSDQAAKPCVDALAKYAPSVEPQIVNIVGCLEIQLLTEGLKRIDGDITPESVQKVFNSMTKVSLSELIPPVSFSPENHMGMQVAPAVEIKNGEWVAAGTLAVPVVRKP